MTETGSTELNEQLRQAEKQRIPQASDHYESLRRVHPTGWAPIPTSCEPPAPAPSAARRDALAARFDSDRLVIPAGHLMRLATAITLSQHRLRLLLGLRHRQKPNAVLVVDTIAEARDVLYFKPRAPAPTARVLC